MYNTIVDLLNNAIFDGNMTATTYGEFFVTGFATIACAILVLLPFLMIWRIIKRFL